METISVFFHNSLILQLAIATLLGMVIGAERSHAGKVAGLRTYGLVSLGACLFVLVSRAVIPTIPGITGSDIMHVVAGVITGIGFLGAGAIIMRDQTLTGVTTAAGIWVSAGIGVTVGLGLYAMAIATAILTLLTFTLFWSIEHRVVGVDEKGNGDS